MAAANKSVSHLVAMSKHLGQISLRTPVDFETNQFFISRQRAFLLFQLFSACSLGMILIIFIRIFPGFLSSPWKMSKFRVFSQCLIKSSQKSIQSIHFKHHILKQLLSMGIFKQLNFEEDAFFTFYPTDPLIYCLQCKFFLNINQVQLVFSHFTFEFNIFFCNICLIAHLKQSISMDFFLEQF